MNKIMTNYLNGAVDCFLNAVRLQDSAKKLCQTSNAYHGLFLLYTAREELEKAIFCLFVHHGHMMKSQATIIFKDHKVKILLADRIYKTLSILNGEIFIDNTPLKQLDITKLAKSNMVNYQNYMNKRNSCLYVEPENSGGWWSPKSMKDIDKKKNEISGILCALYGFLLLFGDYDLHGNINHLTLFTIRPSGKPHQTHIQFSSTSQIVKRKNTFTALANTSLKGK